jgi:V8-like Glu-specific endopeptidase
LAIAFPQPASGISIRHDRDESLYLAAAANFPAVGGVYWGGGLWGSGTLIAPNYVLTAAHIVKWTTTELSFGAGTTTTGEAWGVHNENWKGNQSNNDYNYDIGIFRLKELNLTITPAQRYTGTGEKNHAGDRKSVV